MVCCHNCDTWEPAFARLLILGPFEGVMQDAIHAVKFGNRPGLGREMGRRLAACPDFARDWSSIQALIPVPLHPTRQRERGYNQSLHIARGLADVLGRPVCSDLLRRRRATRQQARLEADERQENLRNAFEVAAEIPLGCLGVVDDVATTGATLNACAEALLEAGVDSVWGLALASPFREADPDQAAP